MIGIAYAQSQDGGAPASPMGAFGSMVPIILMILIIYFLLIRPQQKKEKERKSMISAIKEGDKVVTVGGIHGVVAGMKDENTIILKIANNTKVEFSKSSVQNKVS
jgi:preprotein translocase subunit YajC